MPRYIHFYRPLPCRYHEYSYELKSGLAGVSPQTISFHEMRKPKHFYQLFSTTEAAWTADVDADDPLGAGHNDEMPTAATKKPSPLAYLRAYLRKVCGLGMEDPVPNDTECGRRK